MQLIKLDEHFTGVLSFCPPNIAGNTIPASKVSPKKRALIPTDGTPLIVLFGYWVTKGSAKFINNK